MQTDLEKKYRPFVIAASIIIPLVVASLFSVKIEGVDLSFLPHVYATINGITALILIAAVRAIKQGKRELHQRLMKLAILSSLLFLVGYIAYHITSDPDLLRAYNGSLAADLSDPSLGNSELSNAGFNRGNSSDKDWYVFYGMMITFNPFKYNVCRAMHGN